MGSRIIAGLVLAALGMTSGCASSSGGSMLSSLSPTRWFAKKTPSPAERFQSPDAGKLAASPSTMGATGRLGSQPSAGKNGWMTGLTAPFQRKDQPAALDKDDPLRLDSRPQQVNPMLYVSVARLYEAKGDYDNALRQYELARQLDPKNHDVLLGMARAYDRKNDVPQAMKLYEEIIVHHPQSAVAHNDLALCHARRQDMATAIKHFEQAIAIDPQSKLYRNNYATTLLQQGNEEAATQQVMAVLPPAAAHYNIGYLANQIGQRELAAKHFQLALQIDPQLAPARQMLERTQVRGGELATQAQQRIESLQGQANSVIQQSRSQLEKALPALPADVGGRYADQVKAPDVKSSSEGTYESPFPATGPAEKTQEPINAPTDMLLPPANANHSHQSLPPIDE